MPTAPMAAPWRASRESAAAPLDSAPPPLEVLEALLSEVVGEISSEAEDASVTTEVDTSVAVMPALSVGAGQCSCSVELPASGTVL